MDMKVNTRKRPRPIFVAQLEERLLPTTRGSNEKTVTSNFQYIYSLLANIETEKEAENGPVSIYDPSGQMLV